MADENPNTLIPETPKPDVQAEAEAQRAAFEAGAVAWRSKIEDSISALTDTVRGALAPHAPIEGSGNGKFPLPPHMRQLMRQGGLTDADIDRNWDIVGPMMGAMLATDGVRILNEVEIAKDDIAFVRASKNTKTYPYFDDVEETMDRLRDEARKHGRTLPVKAAYEAALAVDIEKVSKKAASRRADTGVEARTNSEPELTDHGAAAGRAQGDRRRTALSANDLAAMTPAQRKTFFEANGDRPIH